MYQRIKNRLDVEILKEELKKVDISKIVLDRIEEIITILDNTYGDKRKSHDMGGYVFFFRKKEDYEKSIKKILDFYNLKEYEYEYSENITEGMETDVQWWEELYMLSSEDSLVFIHSK